MVIDSPALVHTLFEVLAMAVGVRLYARQRRRQGGGSLLAGGNFALAIGCILGAALGSKLVFLADSPLAGQAFLTGGKSMVGGLVGGLVGVEFAKRLAGIRGSTGDAFVFPVIAGIAIGRVGCFLAGLADDTYGIPTGLPWGVDFGDGVPRHPTQLYEIAFVLLLAVVLARYRTTLAEKPGLMFRIFFCAYLFWRLLVDFLKPVHYAWPLGLSGIQWVCLITLLLYLPGTLRYRPQPAATP